MRARKITHRRPARDSLVSRPFLRGGGGGGEVLGAPVDETIFLHHCIVLCVYAYYVSQWCMVCVCSVKVSTSKYYMQIVMAEATNWHD